MTHNEHRIVVKDAWMEVMRSKSDVQQVKGKVDFQVATAVKRCEDAAAKLVALIAVDTRKLEDK